jgi:hypothetical protein
VSVSVAVKLPEVAVGVNVASAGFAFCVQVPNPPPPDQVTLPYVPVAVAPVIVKGAKGVRSHLLRSGPATASGFLPHETMRVSKGLVPRQAPEPVAVRVAVKEPLGTEGVKTARAGFAF